MAFESFVAAALFAMAIDGRLAEAYITEECTSSSRVEYYFCKIQGERVSSFK